MPQVTTDGRGRITIPKAVRERLGERYRLVELADEIKLIPIPSDPIAALSDAAGEELREASIEELREAAAEIGRAQASDALR